MIKQTCKLFSEPVEVKDETVRAASDLVFLRSSFSKLRIGRYDSTVEKETLLKREDAEKFIETMVIGFGRLLEEETFFTSNFTGKGDG